MFYGRAGMPYSPSMDLYAEEILDHFRHPRNKTAASNLGGMTVVHEEKNPACGDSVRVGLTIESGVITRVSWDGEGCAISQAAMSIFSQDLAKKSVDETEATGPKHVLNLLKVPISKRRLKCALLCLHAVHNAIREYQGKLLLSWAETVGKVDE
jgi:nitrogen fixation NifU-like protein